MKIVEIGLTGLYAMSQGYATDDTIKYCFNSFSNYNNNCNLAQRDKNQGNTMA